MDSALRTPRRGWLIATGAVGVGAILALTGCAPDPFPPSGAQDPEVVAVREESVAVMLSNLESVAMGEPLTTASLDTCNAGQDNWKIHDHHYWLCSIRTEWVVEAEETDPAVLVAAYRAHLATTSCLPEAASFDMAESIWALYGPTGQRPDGTAFNIDSLPGVEATCQNGYRISLTFNTVGGVAAGAELPWGTGSQPISQTAFDLDALRTTTAPFLVTLATWDTYHSVLRYGEK